MDSACFEADLKQVGARSARSSHSSGTEAPGLKIQIDSAGGHGMACAEGAFNRLAVVIIGKDFNIERCLQPGNTPIFSSFDLAIWQAVQLGDEKNVQGSAPLRA